jgi:light-regulated signal transduction histidine kinase (bacteriophytochrome)
MALESGADNFLRKPYDPNGLLIRVDNLLSNWELRRGSTMRLGVEIYLGGRKHFITSEREQILDLLISSYEQAVQVNEELKLREAEVRVLNADLERRAQELEAANQELQSFSYSVSHDLRAPLRAIDGFSAILEMDYANSLDGEGKRLLGQVRQGAARMGRLIDDLLEFSRLGRRAIAAAEIDMVQLANEALREVAHSHSGKMPRCNIGELPPAWGDAALIRQVWLNLLSNAVKYSSRREDAVVDVTGATDGSESAYVVRDNGAGFDMRYAAQLFGVFQRLHSDEQFPGTGVGLALVRRIVTRHGGQVSGEGKVNEGAEFRFTLPRQGHAAAE